MSYEYVVTNPQSMNLSPDLQFCVQGNLPQ